MRLSVRCVAAVLAAVFCSGCSNGLEVYQLVKDLRVLSIRALPPEVANDEPIPLQTSVVATVLDPRGGTLEYTWSLCPIQSDLACDDFEEQLKNMDGPTQTMMRKLRAVRKSGAAESSESGPGIPFNIPSFDVVQVTSDLYPGETYEVNGNPYNLTAFLWTHFLRTNLFNRGQGAWPSVVLDLRSSHGDTLRAAKRIVLGVLDYSTIATPLLAQLGVKVCQDTGEGPPGCLTLPPHAVNNSPKFDKVLWAPGPNGPWQDTKDTTGVQVRVGQTVLLRPVPKPESYEDYSQIEASVQTQSLTVTNATEDLAVSWFCEFGGLLNEITWPKYTVSLLNQYTAPARVPDAPRGIDTLWLVARDLRGGEEVLNLPITIKP